MPDPDHPAVARTTSDRGPTKWAAVGLLGGAALVALAWAALGRAPAAPTPTPAPTPTTSAAPPSAPIIVVNLPPPATAPDSTPAPEASPLGPPAQPPITIAPTHTPAAEPAPAPPAAKRINLNTASLDELDLLPGVGKATAQAILDYRTKHGKFRTVSELDKVPGIGPSKLEKLRPLVTVD